jgi:hypothetical protein
MKTLVITVLMMIFALQIAQANDSAKSDDNTQGPTSIIREIR